MQTKAKANSVITTEILPNGHIQFTVVGCEPFTIDPGAVPEVKARRAMVHGIVQRVADGGALGRDKTTGRPATPADKRARMMAIRDNLLDPTTPWERKGAGGAPAPDAVLLRAIAEVQGVSVDDLRARVAAQAEKRGMTVRAFMAGVRAQSQAVRDAEARILAPSADVADGYLDSLGD